LPNNYISTENAPMLISVIVPAYNEERYIGETLNNLKGAKECLLERKGISTEIIVVDNGSTDSTVSIALSSGAKVIEEPQHNVARVRNIGANAADGDVLVFIDADVIVPVSLLCRIAEAMTDEACVGGAVDTIYQPGKLSVKVYLQVWRLFGKLAGMAQGATQFCRRDVHVCLCGYDETMYMGEDVDFYWRLKRFAKRHHARVCFIEDVQVIPSTRRFDRWSLWRMLIWTNPLFILIFRRRKGAWKEWYGTVIR
jgi:glycosyltransferase involved in cell wall biosynthesis